MKKFTLLKSLLLTAILAIGSGSVWAETVTIIPDQETTGKTASAYVSTAVDFKVNDVTYTVNNWNPSTLQVRGNQTTSTNLVSGNNFYFKNKSAVPGNITKIVLNYKAGIIAAKTWVQVDEKEITNQSKANSVAGTAGTNSVSWNFTGSNTFFALGMEKGGTSGTANIVSIEITYETTVSTDPTITVSPTAIDFGTVTAGEPLEGTLTVTGLNLTEGITATIEDTDDVFMIDEELPAEGGELFIMCATKVIGEHTATITLSSAGAKDVTVTLSVNSLLAAPEATKATDVTHNAFTANWEETIGAEEYEIDVYTGGIFFSETFDDIDGTGGNDGQWNGSIASNKIVGLEEWIFENGSGANACIKLGSGSKQGKATTPALGLDGNATLTFRAGAWNGSSENTTLLLEISGGGSLNETSIEIEKAKFNPYSINIVDGTADTKITFKGQDTNDSRFFLDDVIVANNTSVTGYPLTVTGLSHQVTGLDPETKYSYTVTAIAGEYRSAVSNEIAVTTEVDPGTGTGIASIENGDLYVVDGAIHFNATAGERVEIYNSLGQTIYQGIATEGANSIAVKAGVMVVKVGNAINKVIVK